MTIQMSQRSQLLLTAWAVAMCLSLSPAVLGQPVQRTLANGLKVCVVEDYSTDIAAIQVVVHATADCEPDNKVGLRAILQHAMEASWRKQIESDPELAFLLDMEDIGGGLSVSTDWEYVGFGYSGVSDTLPQTLALLASGVFQPELAAEHHEKAVTLVQAAITGGHSAPAESTYALFRLALLNSPARAYPLGTEKTVKNISLADLIAFHRRYYVPNLAAVCVVAPVPANDMLDLVEKAFGSLTPGKPQLPKPPNFQPTDSRVSLNRGLFVGGAPGFGIASIVIGVPAPGCDDPDMPITYIIHALLGANGLAAGRIDRDNDLWAMLGLPFPPEEARKRQIVEALPPPFAVRSHLAVHAYASPRRVEVVRKSVLKQLQQFAEKPPTEEEIERAKAYVTNAYAAFFEVPATRALIPARAALLDLPDPLATSFDERVAQVTGKDIQRVAKTFFKHHAVGIEFPEAPH